MHLEAEVEALRARVERLEATVNDLMERRVSTTAPQPAEAFNQAKLRAWLTSQGVISEPSELEEAAAQQWHTLSEEEKQRLRSELDQVSEGPMVSDIVIEQRR